MKITAIRQQQKRTNRYSIYVDEAYAFSLSETALIDSKLSSGTELSAQQFADYKALSADDKLYNQALRYVAMRQRTVWELQSYLTRKQATPAAADQIIQKLEDLGLLNDEQYALSFVRDRQLLRPTSRRKLEMELKKRRVPSAFINQALAEAAGPEADSLEQVIVKKRRQSKYQDDTTLMQYLARQGYGYQDIKQALQQPDEDY